MSTIDQRLSQLNIVLPPASDPAANHTNDRVRRVVKLQGFVNATEEFEQHPQVLNGCSDLMVEVFGERGVHARSVLGAASLRAGLPLVIESIFEVAPR